MPIVSHNATVYSLLTKSVTKRYIIFYVDAVCRYCSTVKEYCINTGVLYESADTLHTVRFFYGKETQMLVKGLYVAEDNECAWVCDRYKIVVDVKETEKAFILTLISFDTRYGATQIEDMFSKSKKVVIKKDGSNHGLKVWSDKDFTIYPYRIGVPFYFRLKDGAE